MRILRFISILGALLLAVATFAGAQMVRESDAASVAGTLQKGIDNDDEYEVRSTGNQLLIVDLDAEVYIVREEHTDHTDVASAMAGGCTDDGCSDSGEGDEGCGGGGPGGFVLEVLDANRVSLCFAARPTKPGWDTDPRLACLLPERGTYFLIVAFATTEPHETALTEEQPKPVHPYLLNVSLRDLAEDGNGLGVSLNKAIVTSNNRLRFDD